MGKGARSRLANLEKKQKKLLEQQRREKEQRIRRRIQIIAASCVALLICVGIVWIGLWNDGLFLRNTVSISSTNYQIDNEMVSYFFNRQYNTYVNNYQSFLSYIGLDTTKSLKKQTTYDGTTWFDYFMNATKQVIQEMVAVAEEAKAKNVTLNENDQKKIDDAIAALKNEAKSKNMSFTKYLRSNYGTGMKESDVRKCFELSSIYTKYKKIIMDGLQYPDAEIETYYNNHANEFKYIDYKSYTFSTTFKDGATDEEKAKANAETKVKADELAACTTAEAFDAYLKTYLKAKDSAQSEDAIQKTIDATLTEKASYDENSNVSKWAYADGIKEGATKVIEGENQYTVYLLLKAPYRDEYTTKNVRHILLTADTYGTDAKAQEKANQLMEEWKKGEKTAESFAKLAEEYSEDTGSVINGGLYKNMRKDVMVDIFENWAYDSARVPGDVGVIKSDYGYHVMYFEGDGLPAWKAHVFETMQDIDYEAALKAYEKAYSITIDDEKLEQIPA